MGGNHGGLYIQCDDDTLIERYMRFLMIDGVAPIPMSAADSYGTMSDAEIQNLNDIRSSIQRQREEEASDFGDEE